ncbi:unnamed protein product [Soboliphyme baturini]|uniref:Uncharacterized protein n=1 Tax=Soboliphyme baturini TaxID=241478 RepID=A0A183J624_9BILA|nr:unnamed protein product [Soboliphyme baturini]
MGLMCANNALVSQRSNSPTTHHGRGAAKTNMSNVIAAARSEVSCGGNQWASRIVGGQERLRPRWQDATAYRQDALTSACVVTSAGGQRTNRRNIGLYRRFRPNNSRTDGQTDGRTDVALADRATTTTRRRLDGGDCSADMTSCSRCSKQPLSREPSKPNQCATVRMRHRATMNFVSPHRLPNASDVTVVHFSFTMYICICTPTPAERANVRSWSFFRFGRWVMNIVKLVCSATNGTEGRKSAAIGYAHVVLPDKRQKASVRQIACEDGEQ